MFIFMEEYVDSRINYFFCILKLITNKHFFGYQEPAPEPPKEEEKASRPGSKKSRSG